MAKEELGITEANGITEMSEDELELAAGGFNSSFYDAIYNDSNRDWLSKKATLTAYLQRVDNIFWKKKTNGLTQAQIADLHNERAYLKSLIGKLNAQYNPAWIYMDRGYGDLQLEQIHKYGDEHPESKLKQKVKGWQFANTIDVFDPFKRVMEKKPLKPFMVSQLQILFERDQIILSPFDELLHTQLINYRVERISSKGEPIFSRENEHFVDTLCLATLAFTLEFPDITKVIDKPDFENPVISTQEGNITNKRIHNIFSSLGQSINNPWSNKNLKNGSMTYEDTLKSDDIDGPKYFRVSITPESFRNTNYSNAWGSRGGGRDSGFSRRSIW